MRRRGLALGAVIGVLGLVIGGMAVAEPHREYRWVVQQALNKLIGQGGAAGAQARIADGENRVVATSGVAVVGTSAPVPADGRFRAGSITKTFVSTVVLQLVGEGRVALDEPVTRYLPGLVPDGITVRMALQHTSGLYNYTAAVALEDPAAFEPARFRHWEPRELVALATAQPLNFAPGTAWEYSNTNYVVAGLLIEAVTGRPYAEAVEERILRPLDLRDTVLPGDRVDVPGPHAHGYYQEDGRSVDVTEINPSVAHSAGEIISTTADLDRFLDALLDGHLLAPAQMAELTRTQPVSPGYGLGLYATPLPCGVTVWGHDGGIPGYTTFMASTPDTTTRIAVSATTAVAGGSGAGLAELVGAVFC